MGLQLYLTTSETLDFRACMSCMCMYMCVEEKAFLYIHVQVEIKGVAMVNQQKQRNKLPKIL